jgi:hypothetical protein
LVALLTVPPGVVIVILPVVAPAGTTAFIILADVNVTEVEATPLKNTLVPPFIKFDPE